MTPKRTIGQLTIESEPTDDIRLHKWTITGEDVDQVNKTINKIMEQATAAGSSVAFMEPVKIDDLNNSQHGWYKAIGFTSETLSIDARYLLSKEKQK